MRHTIMETEAGLCITLEGEFDLYSCADLRKVLVERVQQDPVDIRLDCTGVDYIDSSGMGLIMQLHFILKKSGHRLALAGLSERILKLFRAIKLDKALGAAIETAPPETDS